MRVHLAVAGLAVATMSVAPRAANALTLTVTSAADSGSGSLRSAITASNIALTADRIEFAIPGGGVHRISLLSALPAITDQVTIDGYTQAGAAPNTLADGDDANLAIEIDGSALPATNTDPVGLLVQADGSVIRGLSVLGFFFRENINLTHGAGIRVSGASNVKVIGNWVGLAADGATAVPNSSGIEAVDAPSVAVGTGTLADRNLVSGNGNGIGVQGAASTSVDIKGNYVGLLPDGNALPSFPTPGSAFVCTGSCGTAISLFAVSGAAIGGFGNERNVIGGGNSGISVLQGSDNFIVNNTIGIGVDGSTPLELFSTAIDLQATSNNAVGGLLGAGGNRIAHALNGIRVSFTSASNALYGNLVYDFKSTNQLIVRNRAIDLLSSFNADGLTANDANDIDAGGNHLQNFPVISNAVYDGAGHLKIEGSLDVPAAAPPAQYRIEVFLTDACGADRTEPQPKQLVALQLVSLSGSQETFSFSVNTAAPVMNLLTATAATPGATPETSEQSPCVAITIDRIFNDGFDAN